MGVAPARSFDRPCRCLTLQFGAVSVASAQTVVAAPPPASGTIKPTSACGWCKRAAGSAPRSRTMRRRAPVVYQAGSRYHAAACVRTAVSAAAAHVMDELYPPPQPVYGQPQPIQPPLQPPPLRYEYRRPNKALLIAGDFR